MYNAKRMSVTSPVYLEIIDFIAAGTTPEAVADFRPSLEAQHKLAALIEREKADGLSAEEKAEVDHFMDLEHILRMAKARARQILSRGEGYQRRTANGGIPARRRALRILPYP